MKKKTGILIVLGIVAMLVLSGCNMYYKMETNIKSDGSGKLICTIGYDEAYYQEMVKEGLMTQKELEEIKKESIQVEANDKTYYCSKETDKFSSGKKLENLLISNGYCSAAYASKDTLFIYNEPAQTSGETEEAEQEDLSESIYMEISATFPKAIVKHKGGVLSNDNKTITWDYDYMAKGKDLYATTSAKKNKSISINVAADKIYKKTRVITVRSGKGTVYLDGNRVVSGKTKAKPGNHILVVMNQNGTKKAFSFTVDKTAPVIFGAENNKTYKKKVTLEFFDSESGIKSISINGKKISKKEAQNKKGYTIKKNGTYKVVAVNNANQKKVITFTIKK